MRPRWNHPGEPVPQPVNQSRPLPRNLLLACLRLMPSWVHHFRRHLLAFKTTVHHSPRLCIGWSNPLMMRGHDCQKNKLFNDLPWPLWVIVCRLISGRTKRLGWMIVMVMFVAGLVLFVTIKEP